MDSESFQRSNRPITNASSGTLRDQSPCVEGLMESNSVTPSMVVNAAVRRSQTNRLPSRRSSVVVMAHQRTSPSSTLHGAAWATAIAHDPARRRPTSAAVSQRLSPRLPKATMSAFHFFTASRITSDGR